MTELQNRLVKNCKSCKTALKVLRIICYVCIGVAALVATLVLAVPGILEGIAEAESVRFAPPFTADSVLTPGSVALVMGFIALMLAFTSVVLLLLERVMGSAADNKTPFIPENVRRIKAVSLLVAVSSVLPPIKDSMLDVLNRGFANADLRFGVEVSLLVFAFVVWCLSIIFEYGVTLQSREDETL